MGASSTRIVIVPTSTGPPDPPLSETITELALVPTFVGTPVISPDGVSVSPGIGSPA